MTKPVLKWAGGKRQLLEDLLMHIPANFGTYHEPFIGGGALFFELQRLGRIHRAVIADANPELINFYQILKSQFGQFCAALEILALHHVNESAFYDLRRDYNTYSDVGRAALLIYFNKTAFNGLMRQNKSGNWNMPWGYYSSPNVFDKPALEAASQSLQTTTVLHQDFGLTLQNAQPGDVVYCDPPYVPVSKTASFVGYSKDGFSLEDQKRLMLEANAAANRGVKVILSNADLPDTRQLYGAYPNFIIHAVNARRAINCQAHKRGPIGELIVVSV